MNRMNPRPTGIEAPKLDHVVVAIAPKPAGVKAQGHRHNVETMLRGLQAHLGSRPVIHIRTDVEDFDAQSVVGSVFERRLRIVPADELPSYAGEAGCAHYIFDAGSGQRRALNTSETHEEAGEARPLTQHWIRTYRLNDRSLKETERYVVETPFRRRSTVDHPLSRLRMPRPRQAFYSLCLEEVELARDHGVRNLVIIHEVGFKPDYFVPRKEGEPIWNGPNADFGKPVRRLQRLLPRFDNVWFVYVPRRRRKTFPDQRALLKAPRLEAGKPVPPPNKTNAARKSPRLAKRKVRSKKKVQQVSLAHEKRLCELWGGSLTENSGSTRSGRKGDFDVGEPMSPGGFKIDVKSTEKQAQTVRLGDLRKVENQAAAEQRRGILILTLHDENDDLFDVAVLRRSYVDALLGATGEVFEHHEIETQHRSKSFKAIEFTDVLGTPDRNRSILLRFTEGPRTLEYVLLWSETLRRVIGSMEI